MVYCVKNHKNSCQYTMEHRRWPWAVHAPILTIYHLWGQFKHFRSLQSCPFTDSACIICDSNTTLLKCLKTTPVHQTPRDQSNPKWIIHKYVNLSFNWPIGEYRSVISRGISTITLGSLGFFLPNNDRNKNAEKSSKYICLNVMSIVSLTFDWTKTIVINIWLDSWSLDAVSLLINGTIKSMLDVCVRYYNLIHLMRK